MAKQNPTDKDSNKKPEAGKPTSRKAASAKKEEEKAKDLASGKKASAKSASESAKKPVKAAPAKKTSTASKVKKAEEGDSSRPKAASRSKAKASGSTTSAAGKSNTKKTQARRSTTKKTEKEETRKATTARQPQEDTKAKPADPDQATLFTDYDIHLFKEGRHYHLYKKLGSHRMEHKGKVGTYFAVWAPNARFVSVIGDFNQWNRQSHPMSVRHDGSGIWEVFIPDLGRGTLYKYFIHSHNQDMQVEKGDPFAMHWETPPETASIVWELDYEWQDKKWMDWRQEQIGESQPISVYELHMGSWRRVPEDDNRSLSYREMAAQLPGYLKEMGFTHVEFMPVMEHPFYGSWGYQVTGYFAPSSRYGTPEDFMHLVDSLHEAGIGVILDWVPSHFPGDAHGIYEFDGTHLYEHADPRKGFHPDWQSYIFNYGRNEVRAFLISNALYWLDVFHADGLRVDAVASMLYLDYSREEGEWEPNEHGGNENLEAISFLKEFNETVYREFPDVHTIAEESTSWPMVSRPTYIGGLGFGQKWMMGWMHDTLEYFKNDPVYRQHHQGQITFSIYYAFHENFMLPLSHDEVVYGKQPLIYKMPGDEWQKFANLRCLYSFMYAHPGTKLLFMGGEFGQTSEWNHDSSLDWHLTQQSLHSGVQETLKALNHHYREEKALYELPFEEKGFEWIDINDAQNSVISFMRKAKNEQNRIVVVCNFTPVTRENYRIGVPHAGKYVEIFNSDDEKFGGSNVRNTEPLQSEEIEAHGKKNSIRPTLPPLGVIYLKLEV